MTIFDRSSTLLNLSPLASNPNYDSIICIVAMDRTKNILSRNEEAEERWLERTILKNLTASRQRAYI